MTYFITYFCHFLCHSLSLLQVTTEDQWHEGDYSRQYLGRWERCHRVQRLWINLFSCKEKSIQNLFLTHSFSLYSFLSIIAETVVRCSVLHAPTTQCSWHPVLSQYASVTVVIRYYYRERQNNYIISLYVCVTYLLLNYYNYTMTMCVMNNYRVQAKYWNKQQLCMSALAQFWYDFTKPINVFVCNCNLTNNDWTNSVLTKWS